MNTGPDIKQPLQEICDRLGLTYQHVGRLEIAPTAVRAVVYLLNEDGKHYVDLERDEAATETFEFEVTT